ncbi:MAG: histidine kinase, partial [Planctomycetes bacterium]|nr:histidine kinase [Planctomycetota bacterium]
LVSGVKRVWASTFSQKAKEFLPMTPYHLEEERMAVIVQRIVGTRHGDRYYPSFAGVARSHNFYPAPPQKPEDGIAAVALGMGKTVVEGGSCVRFSPRHPRAVVDLSDVESALETTQRQFFALDLAAHGEDARSFREADLRSFELDAAESDGMLPPVGSTYDADNKVVYDGVARTGVRLVTFAGVLKHDVFPLAEMLDVLLRIGSDACSGPVEIEFAVNIPTTPDAHPEFGFLQLRPLVLSGELEALEIGEVDDADCVCRSLCVLGNGRVGELRDIVIVDRKTYDRSRSHAVAGEIARINAAMLQAGTQYVLIGVGRWGSADPFLGIPVTWNQIAGARVIVEAGFEDLAVSPSQGTHFFQNLASCDVGYFTVNPEAGEGLVDWEWLRLQTPVYESPMVRHVRLADPVVVKMDGQRGEGVILKPELK